MGLSKIDTHHIIHFLLDQNKIPVFIIDAMFLILSVYNLLLLCVFPLARDTPPFSVNCLLFFSMPVSLFLPVNGHLALCFVVVYSTH